MYSFLLLPFTNHTHSPLPLSYSPPLDPAEWFNHHWSVTTTASTIEHFHRFHYLFSPPNFLVAIDHPFLFLYHRGLPSSTLTVGQRPPLRPLCWLPTYLNCVCFLFCLFSPPFLWFLSPFGFQFFLFFVLLFFLFFALLNFGVLEVRKLHRRVGNHNGPTDRVVNAIRTNPQGRESLITVTHEMFFR